MKKLKNSTRFWHHEYIGILSITGIALLLRLYQLGKDSFWFDEIGVALILRSPNLAAVIEGVRSHVAAMPLDYLIGWLASQSCESEACFRLPAALWGTLSIPVSHMLFRHLVTKKIAAIGALLLALSPLHLQYSQELRFYASLTFFYSLSTLLLLRAIEKLTMRRWMLFSVTVIVGSYFHMFVLLAFLNGLIWVLFLDKPFHCRKQQLFGWFTSALFAAIVVVPGFWFFRPGGDYGMFSVAEAIVNVMIGFGWLPTIFFPLHAGFFWYLLFLVLQIAGFRYFVQSNNKKGVTWGLASLIQVALIIGINMITDYAVRGRQFLIVMPFLCILAAAGGIALNEQGRRMVEEKVRGVITKRYIYFCCVAVVATAIYIPSLLWYYQHGKSLRREISVTIARIWEPGDTVWLTPDWEAKFYRYYLDFLGYPEVSRALLGVDNIDVTDNSPLPVCWVTNNEKAPEEGFKQVLLPPLSVQDTQFLWCR